MKILNIIIIAIISMLLLMSILAIVAIHLEFLNIDKYSFSFTPKGLTLYLAGYANYASLFAGTTAMYALYFGFLRLKAAEVANIEKLKQDRFGEWKAVLEFRAKEVTDKDPFMIRNINERRLQIFNTLYPNKFAIDNKKMLTSIFDKHFKKHVTFYESQNNRHIGMGESYPNDKFSYSYDSFRFLFFGMIESWYDDLERDLRQLYIHHLPKDRLIDEEQYKSALFNYRKI